MKKRAAYKVMTIMAVMLMLGMIRAYSASEFITICYHDIPVSVNNDPHAVDVRSFVDQIEYMRTHGYNFISVNDVIAANKGEKKLPEKAVLLSFDDGYISFASNVVPILELYNCPALLAICSLWVEEKPPADITAPIMSWEQIRKVSEHPLVTVASHSHNLHRAVQYNPQGNTSQAATSRMYLSKEKRYETEREYRARIAEDMKLSIKILGEKTGEKPEIIVWPYGEYNKLTLEYAKKNGFRMSFGLSDLRTETDNLMELDRWLIVDNPAIQDFISDLKMHTSPYEKEVYSSRTVQVDLDLIYDSDSEQQERNLGKFLDRMVAMQPDTVYLQAFADPDGDGNVDSVYFPNRILPMRADLLNRVANQLIIREFTVYVWMPTLSIVLPNKELNERLLVRPASGGISDGYRRLTPFSKATVLLMTRLYEDLAAHVKFHGVLFQDDAYLSDDEDFHPAAIKYYKKYFGMTDFSMAKLSVKRKRRMILLKRTRLNKFTESLMEATRKYRPFSKFARNIYAPVLLNPESEEWFSQSYKDFLRTYDKVVVMAYTEHEGIFREITWLRKLVEEAGKHPNGIDKTVFKIQTYNWQKHKWLSEREVVDKLRKLVAAGAKHVAYYPDDYTVNKPGLEDVRMEMSTESMLFQEPPKSKMMRQEY
ncbi:poly-beta-1,6-N-acetyl-D-glucosamine N-deacetylase PgaB [Verrucomicrobiota bacterium]